jgi:hypothetical protein
VSRLAGSLSALVLRSLRGWVVVAALGWSGAALALPIDLNLLFFEPGTPVSIAADGSSATLAEDPGVFAVFLSNVPAFGDPVLLTAAAGARLQFEYEFDEGVENSDTFHFALLDGLSGDPLDLFNLFVTDSGSGTASFDLSTLVGTLLGLQFELVPDELDGERADSVVKIANLRIETPVTTTVSEPGSLLLFALAIAMALRRRGTAAV